MKNHYEWLEENLPKFFEKLGIDYSNYCGIIVADGDKCGQYQRIWEFYNVPFYHGAAIYLITKISPYCDEVRDTENGWVAPHDWVIKNYEKFKPFLEDVK